MYPSHNIVSFLSVNPTSQSVLVYFANPCLVLLFFGMKGMTSYPYPFPSVREESHHCDGRFEAGDRCNLRRRVPTIWLAVGVAGVALTTTLVVPVSDGPAA